LSPADEKAHYDLHQNSPEDLAYRNFLDQLISPLLEFQITPARALDFGCGPGPTVSVMLEEAGHTVANFDPAYFNDKSVLEISYQMITATEVFEHLARPGEVIKQVRSMLEPGGYLGVMTGLHSGREGFGSWHYKNEPTHICFYSVKTMQWIAQTHSLKLVYKTDRVVIYKAI